MEGAMIQEIINDVWVHSTIKELNSCIPLNYKVLWC